MATVSLTSDPTSLFIRSILSEAERPETSNAPLIGSLPGKCPGRMAWVAPMPSSPQRRSHVSSRRASRVSSSTLPAIDVMSVRLNRQAYGNARTAVAVFRLVNIAFYSVFAAIYWAYPQTDTAVYLSIYTNLLPLNAFQSVAVVHVIFVAAHIVMMFRYLARTRDAFPRSSFRESPLKARSQTIPRDSKPQALASLWRTLKYIVFRANALRLRVFGVRSEYFETVFLAREVFEASLQTLQAYKMDSLQPRLWLNRLFITIVVLNCWTTPLLYVLLPKRQPLRRLLCLVSDYLMDLVSTVVVPTMLTVAYISEYDTQKSSFDSSLWYDDVWFVNMINETQLILISSTLDAVSRLMFSINLLVSLESITKLIRPAVHTEEDDQSGLLQHEPATEPSAIAIQVTHRHSYRIHSVLHWFMVAWGVIVLVLHVHAELRPIPSMCVLQIHPWATTTPSCALLRVVCDEVDALSVENIVETALAGLERKWLTHLVVDSCPQLTIPPVLSEFHELVGLKVTNSTIIQWSEDAALTKTRQPTIRFAYFVRVDFPNGTLPPGLLAPAFPPTLQDLEFCMTNLASIPDIVSSVWPDRMLLLLEYSQLSVVPSALTKMHLLSLSLVGSPVREIPAELFQSTTLYDLSLSATAIQSLPSSVTPSLVSRVMPDWVSETFVTTVTVSASVTPLCLTMDAFDTPQQKQLMETSPWLREVSCMAAAPTQVTTVQRMKHSDLAWLSLKTT